MGVADSNENKANLAQLGLELGLSLVISSNSQNNSDFPLIDFG